MAGELQAPTPLSVASALNPHLHLNYKCHLGQALSGWAIKLKLYLDDLWWSRLERRWFGAEQGCVHPAWERLSDLEGGTAAMPQFGAGQRLLLMLHGTFPLGLGHWPCAP